VPGSPAGLTTEQGITRQAALTTERIVATSRELIAEGGPTAVVVREVARRHAVTAPALYRHVGHWTTGPSSRCSTAARWRATRRRRTVRRSTAPRRFGELFGGLFIARSARGRLRTAPDAALTPVLRDDLRRTADRLGLPMDPAEVHTYVVGFSLMLGTVSVEVSGHLRWALSDSEPFVRGQVQDLLAGLVLPSQEGTSRRPRP